jgi:ParB family chromosome partitioning protein
MARKALGRGLDALIPAGPTEPPPGAGGGGLVNLPVDKIIPSTFQPRQNFEDGSLLELAMSIRSQGVLQPLLVRPRQSGEYELIAGERRFRASKLAGLKEVPALIKEVDDRGVLELSLVENIQREDLDAMEEAEAYRRLLTEFDYTQDELSKRVGKDRATVTNLLRLLKLPDDIKEDIRRGRLTAGHARALLMADSPDRMFELRDLIVERGLSVREVENLVRKGGPAEPAGESKPSPGTAAAPVDIHIREMEQSLIRSLGTKVKVEVKGKGGKIEIQFFSPDELDRIYRKLLG